MIVYCTERQVPGGILGCEFGTKDESELVLHLTNIHGFRRDLALSKARYIFEQETLRHNADANEQLYVGKKLVLIEPGPLTEIPVTVTGIAARYFAEGDGRTWLLTNLGWCEMKPPYFVAYIAGNGYSRANAIEIAEKKPQGW